MHTGDEEKKFRKKAGDIKKGYCLEIGFLQGNKNVYQYKVNIGSKV